MTTPMNTMSLDLLSVTRDTANGSLSDNEIETPTFGQVIEAVGTATYVSISARTGDLGADYCYFTLSVSLENTANCKVSCFCQYGYPTHFYSMHSCVMPYQDRDSIRRVFGSFCKGSENWGSVATTLTRPNSDVLIGKVVEV